MSFNKRLKERREALGLTRAQLAKLLEIQPSAIANYENGISHPKTEILYKLFTALDVDANYLYQDEISQTKEAAKQDQKREQLLTVFNKLNDSGKDKVIDYAQMVYTTTKESNGTQAKKNTLSW